MKPVANQVVNLSNNEVMTSSFKIQIPASSVLPKKARYAHVFKDLHGAYPISLGQLYGDGYILEKTNPCYQRYSYSFIRK